MNEEESVQQTRAELGMALHELKVGLDEVLARARKRLDEADHRPVAEDSEVTPDVGGALWELLRSLPGVIGNSLSGDEERMASARQKLSHLDGRLRSAGVDLDDRFVGYADRLASLREQPRPEG